MPEADYRLMTEATGQRIAAALENLAGFGDYLTTADVVNNLTSTATDKPLSAAQGKILYDDLTKIIKGGGIAAGVTETIESFVVGAHILALSRVGSDRHVVVMTDYWADTFFVVSGTIPSGITITKQANSHSITIANSTGSSIAYTYI